MASVLNTTRIPQGIAAGLSLVSHPREPDCNIKDMGSVLSARSASFQKAKDALNDPEYLNVPKDERIRICAPSEYKEVARCLAESFVADDVARYLVDTPDRAHHTEKEQFALHQQIMEYIACAHLLKGLVTAIGDDYKAVALWMPPGETNDDWLTLLRSGTWRLRYQLSAEGRKRYFTEFLPLLHDSYDKAMGDRAEDTWYLVYIGARPDQRGKGLSKKLMAHITKLCDEEQRALYLEATTPAAAAIYQRSGFEVRRQIYLQGNSEKVIPMDLMVREPKPRPA